jgi:hypothetical protein
MRPTNVTRLFDYLKEINRRQSIPASELGILEERLVLAFKPPKAIKPRKERDSTSNYKLQHAKNKGRKTYLQIAEEFPHLFIPFILTFKPKACEKFNIEHFRSHDDLDATIDISNEVRDLLEGIAVKYGFHQEALFQQLISQLIKEKEKSISTLVLSTHSAGRGPRSVTFSFIVRNF